MELGRAAWIRRDRLERIANAERDRRAGRTAIAIAALGEATEWPARAVLALALLPDGEGTHARRILEEGLDLWADESGLPSLAESLPVEPDALPVAFEDEVLPSHELAPLGADGPEPIELAPPVLALDRPIEAGELERAFAEAEAQVDEMHDVNRVAERVLFDEPFGLAGLPELDPPDDELDPLEASAREAGARRPMDAASVPARPVRPPAGESALDAPGDGAGPRSRAVVLATLERWLQNLERGRAGRLQ